MVDRETAELIRDVAAAAACRSVKNEDGGMSVIIPQGYMVHKIPPVCPPPPPVIKANCDFTELSSFVEYVNRFKTEATAIFAICGSVTSGKTSFTAVLDYHDPKAPGRCVHTAHFSPPYATEWNRWRAANSFTQAALAEFIEENRRDIHDPTAAQLLEIVTRFKASKKVEFNSVTYQSNGDMVLGYTETTEGGGKSVVVPEKLKIGIPIFFKGDPYAIDVFLRYKITDGKLAFTLKLDRADYAEQAAFDTMREEIASKTIKDVSLVSRIPAVA